MKYVCFYVIFLFKIGYSQENSLKVIDSLYREDQFYFNSTYNTLLQKTDDLSTNTIAVGFNAGFLRDFPINKSRTWAIAPGFGIGTGIGNSIKTTENFTINNQFQDYNFSKFSYLNFDVPLEIRWRDSSPTKRDFLRVYTGFKFSYLYFYALENIEAHRLKPFQYGPYFSIGYGTWNFYMYYGLSSVFEEDFIQKTNQNPPENYNLQTIRSIQAGLIFYML